MVNRVIDKWVKLVGSLAITALLFSLPILCTLAIVCHWHPFTVAMLMLLCGAEAVYLLFFIYNATSEE